MFLEPITCQDKLEICSWKYEGVYSVYNLPPYQELAKRQMAFAHPKKERNYFVCRRCSTLIGYVNLLEKPAGVFIGMGVAPALCGQGYGRQILSAGGDLSQKLYPGRAPYLGVRCWNKRAIRCYEAAGFQIDGPARSIETLTGPADFYRMLYRR